MQQQRINVRVWTMNNHFTTYHMQALIHQQGPLRHYSCRSLERTIQKYTNLSKSRSRTEKENENILTRLTYFKQLNVQSVRNSLLPPRQVSFGEFFDHPDDHSIPQLWKNSKIMILRMTTIFPASSLLL